MAPSRLRLADGKVGEAGAVDGLPEAGVAVALLDGHGCAVIADAAAGLVVVPVGELGRCQLRACDKPTLSLHDSLKLLLVEWYRWRTATARRPVSPGRSGRKCMSAAWSRAGTLKGVEYVEVAV